jgi:hypothetical protein
VHNKIEYKNIVAYGSFKRSISRYTRNRMHNPTIKFVNANLAYSINKYKNIKRRLLICNANTQRIR